MADQQSAHGKRIELALQRLVESGGHRVNSAMISPSSSLPASTNPKLA